MAFSSAVTISATLLEPLPFHFQDKVFVSIIEIVATRVYKDLYGFNQSSRFVQEIEIEKPLQIFLSEQLSIRLRFCLIAAGKK